MIIAETLSIFIDLKTISIMENNGNSGKVILALLGGVALGAMLGILLAPDKGSETRKNIVDSAKKFTDKAKNKFRETADSVNGSASSAEGML